MGTHAALDVTTWLGGYDLSGDSNATQLDFEHSVLEDTRYKMRGRSRIAGLESVQTQVQGYTQYGAGQVDAELNSGLGSTAQVISQSPDGLESSVAYLWQAKKFSFQTFSELDSVIPFQLNAQSARGSGPSSVGGVRGRVLKTKADVSATGATGTAYELGAVAAGQYLYAAFHVFSAATTITAVLESDSDNTFASATTRVTFGPLTAAGGTWGTRVAGPITDTWYRLRVTAITGTFSIACTAGIK